MVRQIIRYNKHKEQVHPDHPGVSRRYALQGYKGLHCALHLLNPASRIFSGKGLTLGGSHQVNSFSNNSLFGDLSAILIENAPAYADLIRTPPARIALIEDFEEKMRMITEMTVEMNITSISGVPSWYLVLIRHILDSHRQGKPARGLAKP